GVPLEVCPTSNVRLGVVPDLASHPFERLRAAGATVTVNSDDPPLFATTLTGEYRHLAATFGYDAETCGLLSLAALHASFLSADEKAERERAFRAELASLGEELLGRPVVPEEAAPRARREAEAPAPGP
ncbi:MAG TPA: hypothetical protein VFS60_00145, partial [Thermoanaerobaculia bacterium]|nr:hypothetical protein [Thermoanaerobaculia bacterium]